MELTAKFLSELQKRLKIGNRKGVHLNAIPARSNYKFDLSRLSYIDKNLPDQFIKSLLTEQPLKFRVSWKNNVPDLNMLLEEDQSQLVKITKSFENLINQTETIESEKGINTFGFGFPILIRRDLVDNQLTVSPVLIWSLRVKRTKEFNTWEINRTEDDPIYINEVLINHLLNDAQVEIRQLSEEMLDDGLIDSNELVEICAGLLESINTSHSNQLVQTLSEKLKSVIPIKDKKHYESLPITPNNALIEFGGLFSIFEVQKQNIISDYDHLLGLEGCIIGQEDLEDSHFQPLSSVETDPSQQSILNALGTKRNIVIQGPPGTGKSQSLTAVLINALENQKKTIVVCEKRTALEVLQQAINSKGLHYNCVLIKDIVKDRKVAVDSVRDRIDNHPSGYRSYNYQYSKETLDEITGKAARIIGSINTKHQLLGRQLLSNRDWTMLVGELLKEKRKNPETYQLQYDEGNFEYTGTELSQYIDLIQKGQKLWEAYAPHKHLSFLNPIKLTGTNPFKTEQQIKEDYRYYQNQLQKFTTITNQYQNFYQDQRQKELEKQFEKIKELIQLQTNLNQLRSKIINYKDTYQQIRRTEFSSHFNKLNHSLKAIEHHSEVHAKEKYYLDEKQTATPSYRISMLFSKKRKQTLQHQKELQQMISNLETASQEFRGIVNFRSSGHINSDLAACNKFREHLLALEADVESLINYEYEALDLLCPVPDAYQNPFADDILSHARELQKQLPLAGTSQKLFTEGIELICRVLNSCDDLDLTTSPLDARNVLDSFRQDQFLYSHPEKTKQEFALYNLFDSELIAFKSDYVEQLIDNCTETNQKFQSDNWTEKTLDLNNYNVYLKSVREVLDEQSLYFNNTADVFTAEFSWFNFYNNLSDILKPLINELKNKKDWKRTFQIYYLNSLLIHSADGDMPISDQEHEELAVSLSEIEKEQLRYIKEYWYSSQIKETWQFEHKNPNLTVENLYNKRSSQRFKRLSLRQIVQYDPDLFTSFFPIVLTTPDVCSNLFKGMNGYFDLVIFDEASQLRLEDNLPAILKGKQIVIAGDEHQMPPSNYFSKIFDGTVDDEEDIEEEEEFKIDKNDLLLSCESLLDFATELCFEKRYLDFHYRSRHPYLIDFSNYAFYNQRLQPLPNNFDYTPIRYISVGGTFSEHTNEKEADTVLSILEHQIHRLPNGQYPSIGIATFNIAQRNLIKGKLIERQKFDKYRDFNEKMVEIEKNGFFIKNLENIQRDERDIIIISTTYGINKDGKFMQRFGPITQSKGYKLLNVIITRAKFKIFVCSSIPEEVFLNYRDHLFTEGSNNKRAVFFAYIAYAKAVSDNDYEARKSVLAALAENTNAAQNIDNYNSDLESPFEEEVYSALTNHFAPAFLIPQLQFAGYRIDLVFDTKVPGKPRIAIECDGANYHSSQEAYLYDLNRQKILETHGFIFHRIWSTNWWRNSQRETDKLVSFISGILDSETSLLPQQNEFAFAFRDNLEELTSEPVENNQNLLSYEEVLTLKGDSPIQTSLFEDTVRKESFVTLKYLNTNKTITIKIVANKEKLGDLGDGIHHISVDAPLGKSVLGSVKGDIVKIGDLDNYVEIISMKNSS